MAELKFIVTMDSSQFSEGANKVMADVKQITSSVEKQGEKIQSQFDGIGKSIGGSMSKYLAMFGGAAALKGLLDQMVRVRSEFQKTDVAIRTMLGSKEKADELMNQVREYAKISPLEIGDITKATQMMISFNIEADKVPQYIKAIGDVSMGEKDRFNSLALAFSQMSATGKLMGQDLLQMINAGFNPLATISDKTGKSIAQLKDEMSKGAISAKMVQDAFIAATSAGGKFYGMSENAAKTIGGQLSMLSDAVAAAFNEVGTKSEGIITTAISGVTSLVENYEQVARAIGILITTYGTYKAALVTLMAIEQAHGVAAAAAAAKISILKAAQDALNKSMLANPYALAAAALATLVGAIVSAATATDAFDDAAESLSEAQASIEAATSAEISKLDALNKKMIEAGEGTDEYKKIKQQIIDQYSQYYAGLETEWAKVGNLAAMYDKLTFAIRKSIAARQMKSIVDKQLDATDKIVQDKLDKAYKKLIEKYGNERGTELYKKFFEFATLGNGKGLNAKDWKDLEDATMWTTRWGKNATDGIVDFRVSVKELAYDIQKANKASQQFVENLKNLYDVEEEAPEPTTPKVITPTYDTKATAAAKKAAEMAAKERERQAREQAKEREKLAEIYAHQLTDEGRRNADIEFETRELEIKALKDGTEKTIREIELSHDKELSAITRWYEDIRQKRIDEAKKVFDAKKANEGKNFFESEEYTKAASNDAYTKQEQDALKRRLDAANKIYKDSLAEIPKMEQSAMREYLRQYGTYQERRLAIEQEYDEQIKNARFRWEQKSLEQQKQSALEAVDIDFGLKTQQMADLFEDASQKSVKAIDTIIKKYEALIKFMKGSKGETKAVTLDDLHNLGFTDDDIQKVQTGVIKINDIIEAVKNLRKEVEGKSPLRAFTDDIDKAVAKIKDGKLVEGLDNISQAVAKFIPSIKGLTTSIASAFGGSDNDTEGILGIIQAIPDLVTGMVETVQGDTATGLEKVAQSLLAITESVKKTKDEEPEFADWERLKDITESLVSVWDDLIEKKKEYLSLSVGGDTLRTEKEIKELIENETEAWRELGEERLRAGASATHHSIGYRIMRDMTDEAMDAASKALGGNARDILGKTASGLFDLTSEQLQRLKEQAPQFWARLDKDVQNYLNNIIEGTERLEDVQQSVREQLTRTTFDDVKSNFLSQLSDMESAASDFSDDFSQMLFQAMLKTKFDELFNDRLDDWYEHFADSMKDGEISDSERNALLAEWDGIVADSMALRDNLADVTGYAKSMSEGSGAYKAASSFSQEQGDELNGRLTAIQIGQAYQNEQLTMAVMTLQSMSVVGQEQGNTLAEMRNLMLIGNGHLEDIARYTRIAAQYGDAIETIADKIKTL